MFRWVGALVGVLTHMNSRPDAHPQLLLQQPANVCAGDRFGPSAASYTAGLFGGTQAWEVYGEASWIRYDQASSNLLEAQYRAISPVPIEVKAKGGAIYIVDAGGMMQKNKKTQWVRSVR